MKRIMNSFLSASLLFNVAALVAMGGNEATEEKKKIFSAYEKVKSEEQSKRKLRYLAAGTGAVGLGGLYYWLTSDNGELKISNLNPDQRRKLFTFLSIPNDIYNPTYRPHVSWSAQAKRFILKSGKGAFFGASTIITTILFTALQGVGIHLLLKGIINPLTDKIFSCYSMQRFIATHTHLNRNIEDLILNISSLDEAKLQDKNLALKFINNKFDLLEDDIINILGFVVYINSQMAKNSNLLKSGRIIIKQIKQSLKQLRDLKAEARNYLESNDDELENIEIDGYKKCLNELTARLKSFDDLSKFIGTDFMEDTYDSVFDKLKLTINLDRDAKDLPPTPSDLAMQLGQGLGLSPEDLKAMQQMMQGISGLDPDDANQAGLLGRGQDQVESDDEVE